MLSYIESLKYPTLRGKMVEDDFGKRWHDNICMVNERSKMSYRQVIFLTLLFLGGLEDLSYRTKNLVSTIFAMKLDSFIRHQTDRLPVIKCHVYDDILTSLVKNWCLSLFLIYLSLSIRSYLPTETWCLVPWSNKTFSIQADGDTKNSKKLNCLHFNCYVLRTVPVNTVFRSKRGDLWKQGLSNTGL